MVGMNESEPRSLPTWAWAVLGGVLGFALTFGFAASANQAGAGPDLSRFDPDVYPPIDVSHRVPTVAIAGEELDLEFDFACGYQSIEEDFSSMDVCEPEATLWVGYGDSFAQVPLAEEDRDSLRVLTARVPAINGTGEAVTYYREVRDNRYDLTVRYPTVGSISPFVAAELTDVALPQAKAEAGDQLAALDWGDGPDEVGLDAGPEQSVRGPQALAVGPSGDVLAILDNVNSRVLTMSSTGQVELEFPVDVALGDIAIDDTRFVTVLDSIGLTEAPNGPPIPRTLVYDADGNLLREAFAYVNAANQLETDGGIKGIGAFSVNPFTITGSDKGRVQQRNEASAAELSAYFRHDGQILLADRQIGSAFRVTAKGGIGPVAMFERYNRGYLLAMEVDSGMQLTWLAPTGELIHQVLAPNSSWADMNPMGRIAVDDHGTVYLLGTREDGIQILRFEEG